MRLKTISYQKVFPIAAYVNEKIGVEIEINDGDDEQKAFQLAKDTVNKWGNNKVESTDEWNLNINRHAVNPQFGRFDPPLSETGVKSKEEEIADALYSIKNFTGTKSELHKEWFVYVATNVRHNPELNTAFKEKERQLQNK